MAIEIRMTIPVARKANHLHVRIPLDTNTRKLTLLIETKVCDRVEQGRNISQRALGRQGRYIGSERLPVKQHDGR